MLGNFVNYPEVKGLFLRTRFVLYDGGVQSMVAVTRPLYIISLNLKKKRKREPSNGTVAANHRKGRNIEFHVPFRVPHDSEF